MYLSFLVCGIPGASVAQAGVLLRSPMSLLTFLLFICHLLESAEGGVACNPNCLGGWGRSIKLKVCLGNRVSSRTTLAVNEILFQKKSKRVRGYHCSRAHLCHHEAGGSSAEPQKRAGVCSVYDSVCQLLLCHLKAPVYSASDHHRISVLVLCLDSALPDKTVGSLPVTDCASPLCSCRAVGFSIRQFSVL